MVSPCSCAAAAVTAFGIVRMKQDESAVPRACERSPFHLHRHLDVGGVEQPAASSRRRSDAGRAQRRRELISALRYAPSTRTTATRSSPSSSRASPSRSKDALEERKASAEPRRAPTTSSSACCPVLHRLPPDPDVLGPVGPHAVARLIRRRPTDPMRRPTDPMLPPVVCKVFACCTSLSISLPKSPLSLLPLPPLPHPPPLTTGAPLARPPPPFTKSSCVFLRVRRRRGRPRRWGGSGGGGDGDAAAAAAGAGRWERECDAAPEEVAPTA